MDGKSVIVTVLWCCYVLALGAEPVPALCSLKQCACHKNTIKLDIINCTFGNDESLVVKEGALPQNAYEVYLSGARNLVLAERSFSRLQMLSLLEVSRVEYLHIQSLALLNMSSTNLNLGITACRYVTVETGAFKEAQGPSTVKISKCGNVILGEKSFSWLIEINITDVPSLELSNGTFKFEAKTIGRHGVATKIIFNNVAVKTLPSSTFGSPVAEIRLQRTFIETIHADAFNGISYNAVIAINSSFDRISYGAFAHKTLIEKIEFYNCTIRNFDSGALLSSTQMLVINRCNMRMVSEGAVNLTAATVTITENDFDYIQTRGFDLQQWDKMRIESNFFNRIDPDAFVSPERVNENAEFRFINNSMMNVTTASLRFIGETQAVLPTVVYANNHFHQECMCDMGKWLRAVFGDKLTSVELIMDNSFCSTKNPLIVHCLDRQSEGNMQMMNYTIALCDPKRIKCKTSITKNVSIVPNEIQNTRFQNRRNQQNDDEGSLWDSRYMIIIISVAAIAILLIVLLTTLLCVRRKGYCVDVKNAIISSNNCCVSLFDRLFNARYGLDTARSISRLSINEYTESHRLHDARIINIENGAIDTENLIDDPVTVVDKATQTLPEELTKELLESLREKLDDPDNYSEAREMIEHLYDLIKVEECCNANNTPNQGGQEANDRDDLYDVISVPARRQGRNKATMVSVGTRTPSLERLSPFSPYVRQTALCHEYFEPRDRAMHLYAELPGDALPDLLGEGPSRPHSFLRAIGERITPAGGTLVPRGPPGPPSTASTAGTGGSARSARLANRPLPAKPRDPGEGTSSQRL